MAQITVELPSILVPVTGGERFLALKAETLAGAFQNIAARHPRLAAHVFDERGQLRQHVLCFLNDRNTRWFESIEAVPLADGDRITIMQAVSGG